MLKLSFQLAMQFQQNIYVNYVISEKREQRLPVSNISHITCYLYFL